MTGPGLCTDCGAPMRENNNFCANCGAAASAGHQEPDRPGAVVPDETTSEAEGQTTGESGTTGLAKGPPPIPSGPSGRTLALVAGVVGVVVVVSIFGFLVSGSSNDSEPTPTTVPTATTLPGSTTTSSDVTTDDSTDVTEPPNDRLRNLVPKEVGDFTLVDVRELTDLDALGALTATYRSSDGVVLVWQLLAWPTREKAEESSAKFSDFLVEEREYRLLVDSEVKSEAGAILGRIRQLRSEEKEYLLWTVTALEFAAISDHGGPVEFFKELYGGPSG